MSIGALKTLMTMLEDSPTLAGVSVEFGEENINAQDVATPFVCIVPRNGTWYEPGYIKELNPNIEMLWATTESVDVYLWDFDSSVNADLVDHADKVEQLRAKVLQALQNQRPYGLYFKPVSGRWSTMQEQQSRYGRGYVLTVQVEIGIPDVDPTEVTMDELTLTATIST